MAIFSILLGSAAIAQKPISCGIASYYGNAFHGKLTASGEIFNKEAMTAAHKFLSFGTKILVVNKSNERSVEVMITDRGPYTKNRILDLSEGAASKLRMKEKGIQEVCFSIIK